MSGHDPTDFEIVSCKELVFMGFNEKGNLKIHVAYDDPPRDIVIPKSEIDSTDMSNETIGREGYIDIPRWLAEREDLGYSET